MKSFLDNLMPTVEAMEDAPAAFSTTLHALMNWLKTSSREANVVAFADHVIARVPELVGANVANTPAELKDEGDGRRDEEGAARPEGETADPGAEDVPGADEDPPADGGDHEAEPDGSEAVVVPDGSRRERPTSQDVKTSGPAEADNEGSPPNAVKPDTAPTTTGFAGFSQHADADASRPAPLAR